VDSPCLVSGLLVRLVENREVVLARNREGASQSNARGGQHGDAKRVLIRHAPVPDELCIEERLDGVYLAPRVRL